MSNTNTKQSQWVCDAIQIKHTEVSDKGVVYTVVFNDFMGLTHELKVNRKDCFFDFGNVLKTLVAQGFRFNTLLPNAIALVQYQLTSYQPSSDQMKQALKLHKAMFGKDGKGASPEETIKAVLESQMEDGIDAPESKDNLG